MMQAGIGPNGVIGLAGVQLIKAHHTRIAAKPFGGQLGDFGDAIGRINLKTSRHHSGSIPSATATQLENGGARAQLGEKLREMTADAVRTAGQIRLRRRGVEVEGFRIVGCGHGVLI